MPAKPSFVHSSGTCIDLSSQHIFVPFISFAETILRFAGASYHVNEKETKEVARALSGLPSKNGSVVDFEEMERRAAAVQMDVFTGELKK